MAQLNEAQQRVVNTLTNNILLLASAGTEKQIRWLTVWHILFKVAQPRVRRSFA